MNPKIIRSEFNYITSQEEDLFGREKFVEAIVDKIVQRSKINSDCETIGVYGEWGEGKSSVLKLIKNKLDESLEIDKTRFRRVDFNPWYFKDQESLLFDFFSVLQKGYNTKEIKESIKKYAPVFSFGSSRILEFIAPGAGTLVAKGIEKLLETISNLKSDVNSLKDEVDQSILLAQEHVVVFIDDVDRLDKKEMHALFKLIKQGADFINVTYVIAMDVDIVAKSISSQYEDGSEYAGRNFLDKIVQYPYTLPKIQEGHIYRLLSKGLSQKYNKILSSHNEELIYKDFSSIITNIAPLFTTARKVLHYVNSFSFGYGFVHNEVCLEDICYLKVLKMFHPKGYDKIKNSKDIIVNGFTINLYFQSKEDAEEDALKRINKFILDVYSSYEGDQKIAIERVVKELLDSMKENLHNRIRMDAERRLCSSNYFDKYFIYTNPEGIISDTQKGAFINGLSSFKDDELLEKLEFFFNNYEYDEFTRVLRSALHYRDVDKIKIDAIAKICIALSRLSVNKKRSQYTESNTRVHIEILIVMILNSYMYDVVKDRIGYDKFQNEEKQIETFKKIIDVSNVLRFHMFFATHFIREGNAYFTNNDEVNKKVFKLIVEYINQNSLDSFLDLGRPPLITLLGIWKKVNSTDYNSMIEQYIFTDSFEMEDFLTLMIPQPRAEFYNEFIDLFDASKVYEIIKDKVQNKSDTEHEAVHYFSVMYNKSKKENNIDNE